MEDQYSIHPATTVIPAGKDIYIARVPIGGGEVRGDPYLIRLLAMFTEDGKTVAEILSAYPFRVSACEAFLRQAITAGILIRPGTAREPPMRVQAKPTFAGTPTFNLDTVVPFTFLGVPWDQSTTGRPGARFGPAAVRGAAEMWPYCVDSVTLHPIGFADLASGRELLRNIALADAGDVYLVPGEDMAIGFTRVTESVKEIRSVGTVPIVIGGDHSITHAVLGAYSNNQPIQILHIDAHSDLGDGLPGKALHHGSVFTEVLKDYQFVEHIVQVGLRGIYDSSALEKPVDVVQIGMDLFRENGVQAVIDVLDPELPIYVSLDIDGIDPAYAPSTGTPVPGGLRPDEVKKILRKAGGIADFIGFDVVEVSSESVDATATIAAELCLVFADSAVEGMRERLAFEYDDAGTETE